jgi:hypothetical protein
MARARKASSLPSTRPASFWDEAEIDAAIEQLVTAHRQAA